MQYTKRSSEVILRAKTWLRYLFNTDFGPPPSLEKSWNSIFCSIFSPLFVGFGLSKFNLIVEACLKQSIPSSCIRMYIMQRLPRNILFTVCQLRFWQFWQIPPDTSPCLRRINQKKHDSHQVLDCQDLARSWNSKTWYDMHDCNNMQATLKLAHDIHDCNDMQDTLKITPEAPGRSHRCAGWGGTLAQAWHGKGEGLT